MKPVPEPAGFDAEVRQRGRAWLLSHPAPERPKALWSAYVRHLEEGFGGLCGYSAMRVEEGTVDHYRSCATRRELAYEWDNYRFASARMNSVKGTADDKVLDPYEVGEGWFEVRLPSLQMVMTDRVPEAERGRARYTLTRLGLGDGAAMIRRRQAWYEAFLQGCQSLFGLRRCAPLVAEAVERRLSGIDAAGLGAAEGEAYRRFMASELTLPGLRAAAPGAGAAVERALRGVG